jgi:cytochrome P450
MTTPLRDDVDYPTLRGNGPLYFDTDAAGFVALSYMDVMEVLRAKGWSSDLRNNVALLEQLGGPGAVPPVLPKMVLFADPPAHTRLRRLIAPTFAARAVEGFRPRVASIVDAALDGLGAEAELMTEFAYPIPVAVITELLDAGTEGAELIRAETPRLTGMLEVGADEPTLFDAMTAAVNITLFLLPIIAERTTTTPGPDLVSALLTLEVDGDRLDIEEVLATCILLLLAGHETTANLIGNGIRALLDHPDQLDLLRHRPELIGSAVDEMLRYDGPVKLVGRTALTEQVVAGQRIQPGQPLLLHLGAANRDPAQFTAPDTFDITRAQGGNLSFGGGPHFCLGAALARLEAEETLLRLLARHPRITPAGPAPWRRSTAFRALDRLPVRFARSRVAMIGKSEDGGTSAVCRVGGVRVGFGSLTRGHCGDAEERGDDARRGGHQPAGRVRRGVRAAGAGALADDGAAGPGHLYAGLRVRRPGDRLNTYVTITDALNLTATEPDAEN